MQGVLVVSRLGAISRAHSVGVHRAEESDSVVESVQAPARAEPACKRIRARRALYVTLP